MIEVESAGKILIRFAAPGVLGDDDAGNGLQELAIAKNGPVVEFGAADRPLGGGIRDSDQIVLPPLHDVVRQKGDDLIRG